MITRRTALVTGSTSGIGIGIAEALAGQGFNRALNGFGDAAAVDALRARLAADHGVDVRYDGADMARAADKAGRRERHVGAHPKTTKPARCRAGFVDNRPG